MSTEAGTQAPPKEDTFTSRRAISALLLGGLGLVVMGQSLYAEITDRNRFLLIVLILGGLTAFALAGRLISRQDSPRWLNRPGNRLSRFLGVSHAQLVLLMLAPCFGLMTALAAGDGQKAVNLAVALLAWLLAWLALLAGSYRPGRARSDLFDRRDVILMFAIGLIAFLLRAIHLGDLPPTLSGDEGSAGLMSIKFLSGETDNPFTIGWFSFPSLYFSIQSLGILLFGQTVLGLRITSAVAGALTVVALYAMVRTLFDRMTAVLAALFLTVLHFHVHFSRIGLNNIWDGLFAVLMFGALAYGWKTGKRKGFVFAGFALGLGQYSWSGKN